MIKEVRTSILIKKNGILDEKRRSESRHNSEEIRTKTIISNIYETRKTIVYKRLPQRFTL